MILFKLIKKLIKNLITIFNNFKLKKLMKIVRVL